VLENTRLAFSPEMTVPTEEEPEMPVEKQLWLFEEQVAEKDDNNDDETTS